VRTPPARQDKAAIAEHARRLGERYALIERQLARRPWLAGDSFTMADIPVGATLYRYYAMDIARPALPHLEAWYERLRERPAYRTHVMVSFEELRGTA
jgi:glutathione S-transferase